MSTKIASGAGPAFLRDNMVNRFHFGDGVVIRRQTVRAIGWQRASILVLVYMIYFSNTMA